MKKKASKKIKIEIPSFEDEKPKKKIVKKTKVKPKVEPKLNKKDFIEIQGENLYLKIPNDLDLVVRVKKILEVYENEFYLEKIKQRKEIPEEIEEMELPEKIENIASTIVQDEVPVPTPTIAKEESPDVIEEQKVVEVKPYENYVICPLCSGKLKKKKLKRVGDSLIQNVKCKNRKCNFERKYEFSI